MPNTNSGNFNPRRVLWSAIFVLLISMALFEYIILKKPQENPKIELRHPKQPHLAPEINVNTLVVGALAKEGFVDIEIQPLTELDFKSKAEVLKLRTEAVYKYKQLVSGDYKPSNRVFGGIEDNRPWWGILGTEYYGSGEKSIEGPSWQSISILNPYLLVVPDFHFGWSPAYISNTEIGSPEYPTHCDPQSLRWHPKLKRAEVTYAAACAKMSRDLTIWLMAYNAKDFSLNYIYVSYKDSRNVFKQDPPSEPYLNPQFIHRGNSCGYPGGCNNLSPNTPTINDIKITSWPAQLVVWFWKDKPVSVETPPDMTFTIKFE